MSFLKKSRVIALLLSAVLVMSIAGCTTAEDDTILLTVSKDGATQEYTMSQLEELDTVTGNGGSMSSTGKISGPNEIKGADIYAILEAVGGIGEGQAIRVEAKDGYSMTMSYKQMNEGEFIGFDAATGQEKECEEMCVALIYEENGEALDEGSGPLRLGIVSDDGTVTEGHWWIKWVTRIDVVDYQEPWTLELAGNSTRSIDNEEFIEGAGADLTEWTDDQGCVWKGIFVKYLIGLVDDEDPATFNEELAGSGYEVEFKASDDFSQTLTSAEIMAAADWIVACIRDGGDLPDNQWPLRFVGTDLSKKQMVGMLTTITIIFP